MYGPAGMVTRPFQVVYHTVITAFHQLLASCLNRADLAVCEGYGQQVGSEAQVDFAAPNVCFLVRHWPLVGLIHKQRVPGELHLPGHDFTGKNLDPDGQHTN